MSAAARDDGGDPPTPAEGEVELDDVVECVLDLAAEIPAGSVSTYGRIAVEARVRCGRGTARQVGRIMALHGDQVPWWRVVTASGAPADRVSSRALTRLRAEHVPLRGDRVDLAQALHAFALPVPAAPLLDDLPSDDATSDDQEATRA
ncbi:cysteine methyltransferase [Serinibacter arcticus]|uniref:Cysteine methyltransferase n=1 Tax=Serinibacter arcticus TaxID=1655435 RepID=A0A2U1ZT27_9MICO|nr:MGMT family protein [Serinibacter arcticus]PWD50138.1 cysteine methyltransferase [Serinibacter arcticus]